MTAGTLDLVKGAPLVLLRTRRHPAASVPELDGAGSFDHVYETPRDFDDVYGTVVCALVEAARTDGRSSTPSRVAAVAERTVVLLRDATG